MLLKLNNKFLGVMALAITLLSSCERDSEVLHNQEYFFVPEGFPEPVYKGGDYEFSTETVELGRKLFYEPALSVDSSISCGSCHAQVHGFADHNTALSTGVDELKGVRNSPTLSNLAWYPSFMHDGGVNHLEVFPLAPITNPVEMKHSMVDLLEAINQDPAYKKAFDEAFGTEEITSDLLFIAIAHFQSTLISYQSKYDKVMSGDQSFTDFEQRGFLLFQNNCADCHKPPLFTDFSFVNNGLDMTFDDPGRALISMNPLDSGKFKVPSLRNIGLTYPYMHDGRFYSLEEVLDHYASGVKENGYLDDRLTKSISLTAKEKEDLISFLETLTDYKFISNSNFSEI